MKIQPCFKVFTLSASFKTLFTVKSMPCQSTSTCCKIIKCYVLVYDQSDFSIVTCTTNFVPCCIPYVHLSCDIIILSIPLYHKNRARVPRPSLPRAGDLNYIQRCGWEQSGL